MMFGRGVKKHCLVDRNVWKPDVLEEVVLLGVDGDRLLGGAVDEHPLVAPVQGQSQVEVHQTSSLVNVHDAPGFPNVSKQATCHK